MSDGDRPIEPSLDLLDEEGEHALHEASMRIIEQFGIQINHDRASELLVAHGASRQEDEILTIPRHVVEDGIDAAPVSFTLHGRTAETDVCVGGAGRGVRAPAYGPSRVLPFEGTGRPSLLADYERFLKLAHEESVIDCVGYNVCEPTDLAPAEKHLVMVERALTLSDKPLMGSTHGATRARASLDLVGIARGDPKLNRPYVAGLVNTVPPRSFEQEALDGLLLYADHGQPVVISSFTMAGASGPPSLPAAMAQANAETLVGITIAQLVTPGTPVVYGIPTAAIDARYGSLAIGSAASAQFVALAGQMGRFYDLPARAGGGLSDAKAVDFQSGAEASFLQAVTAFAGIDFVLHTAGILESYGAISPEKFVLDCATLRSLDRFRSDIAIDADAFSLDRIKATEPASHYLEDRPNESPPSAGDSGLLDKRSYGDWTADGQPSTLERAHDHVERTLDAYECPPLEPGVSENLDRYVSERRT